MGEIPLEELNKISFASFVFHLRATTELHLPPYKGSTLRGGFGVAFKDTVCVMDHRDCDRCILRLKCAYPYIFDTPVPEDSTRMRKYQTVPHPFVIAPPLETQELYKPNEPLSFQLTLIGKAVEYLPYFIYTFERLGRERGIGRGRESGNGKFRVDRVCCVDGDGAEKQVYDGEKKVLSNSFRPLSLKDFSINPTNSELATLNFLTPTRITYNGQLHTAPDFHVVIRNLLRRLSNLAYFHCGAELDLDFRGLIERAKSVETHNGHVRWHDWERYSARQDTRMKMGGFVGKVDYQGNLAEFLPILRLGEVVHVGKGTVFGLGRYEVKLS